MSFTGFRRMRPSAVAWLVALFGTMGILSAIGGQDPMWVAAMASAFWAGMVFASGEMP